MGLIYSLEALFMANICRTLLATLLLFYTHDFYKLPHHQLISLQSKGEQCYICNWWDSQLETSGLNGALALGKLGPLGSMACTFGLIIS